MIRKTLHAAEVLFDALYAPINAIISDPDGESTSYRPLKVHVLIWLYVALGFSLGDMTFSWLNWHWPIWAQSANWLAWIAVLVCRLALVEHRVADIKASLAKRG